ncbi:MAG: MFS transporter [Lentisphaeria bacterium]|nr:MFS transporter [Lentisphaeria bacterium]
MNQKKNYKKTLTACYLGFVTQAISANFTPLLFLTFKGTYHVSLEQLALIPLVFYFTQLLVDTVAAKYADKAGYRLCVIASQVLSSVGLIALTFLPDLMSDPFIGILIAVGLYAVGSGLIEVLLSPIVEACPFENKAGVMSLLHSFYCWGAVGVILGSTLFFALFGIGQWKILTILWALIPLYNALNFISCPIEKLGEDTTNMSIRKLLSVPMFWMMIFLMICAGSSEATMCQWSSAFTESALNVSKFAGDLAGPCLFAAFMGIARMMYGKLSKKLNLIKNMLLCGLAAVVCYLLASLASLAIIGLLGCALCGLAVGIMWPGTISLSSRKCPGGGTAMFAFLALAGDLGASAGPVLVGKVAEATGENLKNGLLAATIFPVCMTIGLFFLYKHSAKKSGCSR